jgi:IPT/TIG domain/WD40-like Beta Propeller Repeat
MGKMKVFLFSAILLIVLLPRSTGSILARAAVLSPSSPPPSKEEILALKRAFRTDQLPPILDSQHRALQSNPHQPFSMDGNYAWSKIAYQSFIDDNYEVIVATGDGSDPHRLTFNPANDGRVRLNRGANRVAFSSNRDGDFEIYTMNLDGSNLRQLTFNINTDARPAWSPNGNKIAYWSDESGHAEIYVINADGSGKTQITSSGGLDCYDPTWSPDGTRLAYVTWDMQGYGYLWIVSASGGTPEIAFSNKLFLPGDTIWSPDGNEIALDLANDLTNFNEYFFIGNLTNGTTVNVDIIDIEKYEDHYLGAWAPDGKELIFNRIQYTVVDDEFYVTNAFMDIQCRVMDPGCPTPIEHLPGSGLDFLPDWQSADIEPPSTQIKPLPAYSREDGFPVKWDTKIDGLARLTGYNLQYRDVRNRWLDWTLDQYPSDMVFIYGFSSGNTLSFRLQAFDQAGNIEPWTENPNGDAWTTLYALNLKGRASDLRDWPVPAATLAIDPAPLNQVKVASYGNYQAWMQTQEAYTITAQAAGFGKIYATPRDPRSDLDQDLYFPPLDDLIKNGGFEIDGDQSWQTTIPVSSTDHLTATLQTGYRSSGSAALTLGSACQEPCFLAAETFAAPITPTLSSTNSPSSQGNRLAMAVQEDGTVLIIAWESNGLMAFQRSPQGTWTTPVTLDPDVNDYDTLTMLKLTPSGGAIAIWNAYNRNLHRMAIRTPSGSWGSSVDLPFALENFALKDVAMDSKGGLYFLYLQGKQGDNDDLFAIYRTPEGAWQAPFRIVDSIFNGPVVLQAALTITPDHLLHVFWVSLGLGYNLNYRQLNSAGDILENVVLFQQGDPFQDPMIALSDELGQVHLVYEEYGLAHLMRYADGSWSAHERLPDELGWLNSVAVRSDSLYLIGTTGYLRYEPGFGWSLSAWSPDSDQSVLELDANGLLHIADDTNYRAQARATQDGFVSIHQRLTIPASLHKPSLSYLAQFRGPQGLKNSYFEASLTQGITTTQVFSGNIPSGWEHHWLALDAWAGKEITVTFTLHQGAGDPLVYLDLDDISLGAWETPVIDSVAPAALPVPAGQVITITGQNFIQKPQVFIGQTPVPAGNVTWLDENNLRVSLPAGIKAGDKDLKVVNPAGQAAILPAALRIGRLAFIPLLER